MSTSDQPVEPPANADRNPLSPRIIAAAREAEVSPRRAELRRVADATRALIEGLVGTELDEATISQTADRLEELASVFDVNAPRSVYAGISETSMANADPAAFFDHSPLIGKANPLAPPVTLEVGDQVVLGRVRFGSAYEGPPGCVHGGYISAAFDEVLGAAQTFSGAPGMTGTLTIRFRSPTPLHTDLLIEGRSERIEGRRVYTTGRMLAGDRLCAEAEGIFVSIDVDKFLGMRAERDSNVARPPA